MASGTGTRYVPTAGEGSVPQWLGLYQAYIAVNADPTYKGRVKLRVPQVFGGTTSGWAVPVVGLPYIPAVGTQVTCMFMGGDPTLPAWFSNVTSSPVASVTIGSGPPTVDGTNVGDVYYDKSDGMLTYEWNGTQWTPYQIGTAAIATGVGLTEPAISSPSITAGTITGTVITGSTINGGTFNGANWIENDNGMFLYSGTPASGNLLASLSPASGTDAYGNGFQIGLYVYGSAGSYVSLIEAGSTANIQLHPASVTQLSAIPQVFAQGEDQGTSAESQSLVLTSGSTDNKDSAYILLSGASGDGTTTIANITFEIQGADSSGPAARIDPEGIHTYQAFYAPGLASTPAGGGAGTGTAVFYAAVDGDMQVLDGLDGMNYATQRRSLVSKSSQTVTGGGGAVFTTTVGARYYRVHGQLYVLPSVAGVLQFGWYVTSGAGGILNFTVIEGTSTWSTGQTGPSSTASASMTFTTSTSSQYIVNIDGSFEADALGTFELLAGTNGTGTYSVAQYSFLDIMTV